MGNSNEKTQNHNPIRQAKLIDRQQTCEVYQNPESHQQYQRYIVSEASQNFQNEYQFRMKNKSNELVDVVYAGPISNNFGCTQRSKYEVVLERVPFRLSHISTLKPDNSFVVLKTAFKGFGQLSKHNGVMRIKDSMIGITARNQVKVWLNSNFAVNHNQDVPIALKNLDNKNHEAEMVNNIFDLIHSKTQPSPLWSKFNHQKWQLQPKTFEDALHFIQNYQNKNNLIINDQLVNPFNKEYYTYKTEHASNIINSQINGLNHKEEISKSIVNKDFNFLRKNTPINLLSRQDNFANRDRFSQPYVGIGINTADKTFSQPQLMKNINQPDQFVHGKKIVQENHQSIVSHHPSSIPVASFNAPVNMNVQSIPINRAIPPPQQQLIGQVKIRPSSFLHHPNPIAASSHQRIQFPQRNISLEHNQANRTHEGSIIRSTTPNNRPFTIKFNNSPQAPDVITSIQQNNFSSKIYNPASIISSNQQKIIQDIVPEDNLKKQDQMMEQLKQLSHNQSQQQQQRNKSIEVTLERDLDEQKNEEINFKIDSVNTFKGNQSPQLGQYVPHNFNLQNSIQGHMNFQDLKEDSPVTNQIIQAEALQPKQPGEDYKIVVKQATSMYRLQTGEIREIDHSKNEKINQIVEEEDQRKQNKEDDLDEKLIKNTILVDTKLIKKKSEQVNEEVNGYEVKQSRKGRKTKKDSSTILSKRRDREVHTRSIRSKNLSYKQMRKMLAEELEDDDD